ncbi:MAG: DUF881 domain-containing protein [Candidatus Nanopelagicales bacterium]
MRRINSHLLGLAAFALAGFLLTASTLTANGSDIRVERPSELRDLVKNQAKKIDDLENQILIVNRQIEKVTNSKEKSQLEILQNKTAQISPVSGFTSLRGPGLVVTLNDAPQVDLSIPEDERPDVNDLLIHQEDVQAVVNALWAGGAEGISIMGKRIISTSAVKCVGNTLLLHGKVYSPPFKIEAIGDVAKLNESLSTDPNVTVLQEYVDLYGLVFDVQKAPTLELAPYEGSLLLDSAKIKNNLS